jgi:hypothetical protein
VGEVGKFKGVWLPGKLERKCEKIKSGFVSSKFSVPFFPACRSFRFFLFRLFSCIYWVTFGYKKIVKNIY